MSLLLFSILCLLSFSLSLDSFLLFSLWIWWHLSSDRGNSNSILTLQTRLILSSLPHQTLEWTMHCQCKTMGWLHTVYSIIAGRFLGKEMSEPWWRSSAFSMVLRTKPKEMKICPLHSANLRHSFDMRLENNEALSLILDTDLTWTHPVVPWTELSDHRVGKHPKTVQAGTETVMAKEIHRMPNTKVK